MSVFDTQDPVRRADSLQAAVEAIRSGQLIVLPTDTVYGIGADAFDPAAVQDLLDAKGRGRSVPPPVLVGDPAVLMALAVDVPEVAERLAEEFWPGALTLILTAQPSLSWDLGETRGTVALRMPDDETALELLRATGPMAVSSANRHGKDAALTVLDAASQLGDSVEVYLDGGPARIGTSSTIIDVTVDPPEIVREGALTREQIIAVLGDIFTAPEPEDSEPEVPQSEESVGAEPEAAEPETGIEDTESVEAAGADQPLPEAPDAEAPGAEAPEAEAPHADAEPATPGPLSLPRESDAPAGEDAPL